MNIKFTTRGVQEAQDFVKDLPYQTKQVASDAIAEYLVGDESHGLKHEAPYHYVSPFQSYSDDPAKAARQRGWIFTHLDQIGTGIRTHAMQAAWKIARTGAGAVQISNNSDGIQFVMGNDKQSRQSDAVGWRKVSENIQDNMAGAVRHAVAKINEYLKARG
jgi:hypothetical protein